MPLVLAILSLASMAATERFDYDPLGRLIRYVNQQGQITRYHYDAVGNILAVEVGQQALPPSITSITPTSLRRLESPQITIVGRGLTGARLSSPHPSLSISGLSGTDTQLRFTLTAAADAPLGSHSFSISNAEGSASFSLTVNPQLPELLISPLPIAVPPNRVPYNFVVRLSNEDNIDHTVSLAVADPGIAQLNTNQVTIPAGTLERSAAISGLSGGNTRLTASAPGLRSVTVPVFVTAEYAGINFATAPDLGVLVEQPPRPPTPTDVTPLSSAAMGVVLGPVITGMEPNALVVGTGPTSLQIRGAGLGNVNGVSVVPDTGLALGTPVAAPDGRSVTVPITVAADAPTTQRQIRLDGVDRPYLPAHPEADRLRITLPAPILSSIEPLYAAQGTAALEFTVRGAHLGGAQAVEFNPPQGITVGAAPMISTDGTTLVTSIEVAIDAPLGPRTVTVTTPGGRSTDQAGIANTFTVVREITEVVTPIAAPLVGVVRESSTLPTPTSYALQSHNLGVGIGPMISSLSPSAGSVGDELTLTLNGNELQGVTVIQFMPSEGLSVGAVSVQPDGKAVTVSLRIAGDAPQTLREVKVMAGSTPIPFASAEAARFRVAARLPQVESVSPLYLEIGAPKTVMTVRGKNLHNASELRFLPGDGMFVWGSPQVGAAGDELSVEVQASENAAPGPRVVVVTTPAGASSNTASVANTVTVISGSLGPTYSPIVAPQLGVTVEQAPPPPVGRELGPFQSPLLGVLLQDDTVPPPPTLEVLSQAPALGVAHGPVATVAQASGLYRGATGTLSVQGHELDRVERLRLVPATGVSLGTLVVNPDGRQVSVPFTVAADAPIGAREVILERGASAIPFVRAEASRVFLGSGLPVMFSIEPIVASRGSSLVLLIRGQHLQGASEVRVEPAAGVRVETGPQVNAAGTEATVSLRIEPNATLGARVIRVVTPAGVTEATAQPSNTFTVVP